MGKSGADDRRERNAQLRFDAFLADVTLRFLKRPLQSLRLEIDSTLARLADVFEVDGCGLAVFSPSLHELTVEHSFTRHALPSATRPDLARDLPWYARQFREGRRVLINNLERDLPPEATAEWLYVTTSGLRSHVGLPLVADAGPLGALGVASFSVERNWSEELLGRLGLVASAFAYMLYRRRAEKRIQSAEELNQSVLRSLPSELLVLDGNGRLLVMNDSAHRSRRRRLLFPLAEGADYISVLAGVTGHGFPDASRLSEGIASVAAGASPRFETTYTLPGLPEPHRYMMIAMPLEGRPGVVVVAHKDFSELEHHRSEIETELKEAAERKDRLEAETLLLHREMTHARGFATLIGRSAPIARVLGDVDQVAPTESPVLLLGETGTGKEVVARVVHARSRRCARPLISVNCAALPAELLESELFGHERGAFTGAVRRHAGRFEIADGATLFLDEIGELSLEAQAKLLRVVESGEFERLGSARTLKTNVRLIAATNRDLDQARREGRFRNDLYYRLHVFPVILPPLRERPDDIPLLVWHFVAQKQARFGKLIERVPDGMMQALAAHTWPGNVRELEHVIERALILSSGPTLAADPIFLRDLETVAGGS